MSAAGLAERVGGSCRLALVFATVLACNDSGRPTTEYVHLDWATPVDQHGWDPKSRLPRVVRDAKTGIELVLILPGTFTMGAPAAHDAFEDVERPAHRVTITRPYYLARFETTIGQAARALGQEAPSGWHFEKSRFPFVSRDPTEIRRFLKASGFRLPTEAEWEYACTFGDPGPTPILDAGWVEFVRRSAWCTHNSADQYHAVGLKQPNTLGLYDMLGNTEELCQDSWDPNAYVSRADGVRDPVTRGDSAARSVRGGDFNRHATRCRPSARDAVRVRDGRFVEEVGVRVARDP